MWNPKPNRRQVLASLAALWSVAIVDRVNAKKKKRKDKRKRRAPLPATCPAACPARAHCVGGLCVRQVCPTCDYQTIQAAIVDAEPGDTILIAAGTFAENVVIDRNLTIIGTGMPYPSTQGPLTTWSGDPNSSTATVRVSPGVSAAFFRIWFRGHAGEGEGGAMRAFLGATVTLTNCWVDQNRARFGGGILNDGAYLTLIDTLISENFATKFGGGIFNRALGTVRLVRSRVSGNTASGDPGDTIVGGGIYNLSGAIHLEQGSSVSANARDDCAFTSACPL